MQWVTVHNTGTIDLFLTMGSPRSLSTVTTDAGGLSSVVFMRSLYVTLYIPFLSLFFFVFFARGRNHGLHGRCRCRYTSGLRMADKVRLSPIAEETCVLRASLEGDTIRYRVSPENPNV